MPRLWRQRRRRGAVGESVLNFGFHRGGDALVCEEVSLEQIAEQVGTPVYVYSSGILRDRYDRLTASLSDLPHRVHYSLKANSSGGVLRLLRELGSGVDVVSGGELHRALRVGYAPRDIVFGGVGKTASELEQAIEAGVLLINVESEGELLLVDEIAGRLGRVAPIGLRVNPEITVDSAHDYIKTGQKGQKFGIPYDDVLSLARVAASSRNVLLVALDMHVGSQLTRLDTYREGAERLARLHDQLRDEGVDSIAYLDVGGGLAVPYECEAPPDLEHFSRILHDVHSRVGLRLILEPGRFLVGDSAVLLTRVLYRKRSGGKEYVIADAGMTELIRPSHYDAYHRIEPLRTGGGKIRADVVGPVCESGDFLALDRDIPDVGPGDLLAVHGAGAYGYAMSMNYNSRTRPPEVMVDGERWAVVTRREEYDDLVRAEVVQPEWRRAT
jgi:diaminopimelate decarboxylase